MIKYSIIASEKDIAGMNIRSNLLKNFDFRKKSKNLYELDEIELITIQNETLFSDNIDDITSGDIVIFATRHTCDSNNKSLCIHTPGNWGKAKYGGREGTVCKCPAGLLRLIYLNMLKYGKDLSSTITVEATHHGPSMSKPCLFVEIGNNKDHWTNDASGDVISRSIIDGIKDYDKSITSKKPKTTIVLGGGHYNQVANKILNRTSYNVSHICPKYALNVLDSALLKQAINKSLESINFITLDWKGLGSEKERIIKMLEKEKIEYKKHKQVY